MARKKPRRAKARRSKRGVNRRQLLISTLGVGAAYGGLLLGSSLMPVWDEPLSTEIGTHYTIFFDNSEGYSTGQNAMINGWLVQELPDDIRSGDRLDLFSFDPNGNGAVIRNFSAISPKRASEVNRVIESPKRQATVWRNEFWDDFCRNLAQVRATPEMNSSPLIEGWFEISRFVRDSNAQRKVVIVVSDGLQFSSQTGSSYNGSIYHSRSNVQNRFPADFGGADIRMLYLFRSSHADVQNEKHQRWLSDWFEKSNAAQFLIEMG